MFMMIRVLLNLNLRLFCGKNWLLINSRKLLDSIKMNLVDILMLRYSYWRTKSLELKLDLL